MSDYAEETAGLEDDYSDIVDEDGNLDDEKFKNSVPKDRTFVINTDEGEVEIDEETARKLYKSYSNDAKWKKKNTIKSQELADERKAFEEEKEKFNKKQSETFKQNYEKAPDQAARDEMLDMQYEKAAIQLSRQFDDFDWDEVQDFVSDFDDSDPMSKATFLYLAWRGAHYDPDKMRKEIEANLIRKAKTKSGFSSRQHFEDEYSTLDNELEGKAEKVMSLADFKKEAQEKYKELMK